MERHAVDLPRVVGEGAGGLLGVGDVPKLHGAVGAPARNDLAVDLVPAQPHDGVRVAPGEELLLPPRPGGLGLLFFLVCPLLVLLLLAQVPLLVVVVDHGLRRPVLDLRVVHSTQGEGGFEGVQDVEVPDLNALLERPDGGERTRLPVAPHISPSHAERERRKCDIMVHV